MQDKLIIVTRIKKTIDTIEKIIENYPHQEVILKNRITETLYTLLELSYQANIHKDKFYMSEIIVKLKMLDYYIKMSLDKKIISYKKYETVGNHLLEKNKMVLVWLNNEKS